MNLVKLFILFAMILIVNFSLIRIDYSKFFYKGSNREIKILVSIVSLSLGYLAYKAIMTIYELSLNLV